MVIEPFNTVIADWAMPASWGADHVAVRAEGRAIDGLEEVLEVDGSVRDVTRAGAWSQREKEHAEETDSYIYEDP